MKAQITIQPKSSESEIFSKPDDEDYKTCPHCGQNSIPFKYGICYYCKKQIGHTKYLVISK